MSAPGARHTLAVQAAKPESVPPPSPIVDGFSLATGGPFYRSLRRLKLVEPLPNIGERTLLFFALTWVPLLVLAAMDGTALGHRVAVPLLRDFSAYGRFWVGLPLLILAEVVIDPRMRRAVMTFDESGIIPPADRPAYHAALERVAELRNSTLAELLLFLIAFFPFFLLLTEEWNSQGLTTWHGTLTGKPSAAGWWFALVSSPLVRFLLLRWLWRTALWGLLLYRITRLRLRLNATHPDLLGGLGFLLLAQRQLGILFAAVGSVIAGQYGNSIAYLGQRVTDFEMPMGVFVVLSVVLVVGPLLLFTPQLAAVRRDGLYRYGQVGRELTNAFDAKWAARDRRRTGTGLLGDPDPSSLIDYISSFQVIRDMRVIPINRDLVLLVAAQAAAPLAVVWFLATPLDQIIAGLLKMLA